MIDAVLSQSLQEFVYFNNNNKKVFSHRKKQQNV